MTVLGVSANSCLLTGHGAARLVVQVRPGPPFKRGLRSLTGKYAAILTFRLSTYLVHKTDLSTICQLVG
jgi:hypothetical protein